MFETDVACSLPRRMLLLVEALVAGGLVLLLLSGPERQSPAYRPSNHSLVRHLVQCDHLRAEALTTGSVAKAALARLHEELGRSRAEFEGDRSRRLHEAEACEVCNAERVAFERSVAEGAASLLLCEAEVASSAASCEAGQLACQRERERAGAEGAAAVVAVAECETTAAWCDAERLALGARVSELLPLASELATLRAAGKACEEEGVAASVNWRSAALSLVQSEVQAEVQTEVAAGLLAGCVGFAVSLWWWWRRRRAVLATTAQAVDAAAAEVAAQAAQAAAAARVGSARAAAMEAAAAAEERARLQVRLETLEQQRREAVATAEAARGAEARAHGVVAALAAEKKAAGAAEEENGAVSKEAQPVPPAPPMTAAPRPHPGTALVLPGCKPHCNPHCNALVIAWHPVRVAQVVKAAAAQAAVAQAAAAQEAAAERAHLISRAERAEARAEAAEAAGAAERAREAIELTPPAGAFACLGTTAASLLPHVALSSQGGSSGPPSCKASILREEVERRQTEGRQKAWLAGPHRSLWETQWLHTRLPLPPAEPPPRRAQVRSV